MKFYKTYYLILFLGINFAFGKTSHLLVSSIGEGVLNLGSAKSNEFIATSSFLPNNTKLSVRPKSGIETLASGYLFRFGSSTAFVCRNDSLEIFSGSIFIRSRNFKNSISFNGPETSLKVSGAGSCIIEVEKNGGFKCVGVLGSLRLGVNGGGTTTLLPGELIFTELKTNSLSDKVTVNLKNLFETSFLISGFPNSSSFEDALKSVAESQALSIGKLYNATIGSSSGSDRFEVKPQTNSVLESDAGGSVPVKEKYLSSYELPSESPLQELLGRRPQKMQASAKSSGKASSSTNPKTSTNPSEVRPFPSRLLRGK